MARKQRFMREYQLPATDAQSFVWNQRLGARFEEEIRAIAGGVAGERRTKRIKSVANLMINSSVEPYTVGSGAIVELAGLVEDRKISSAAGQQVYALMAETGRPPMQIVEERGLAQVSDAGAIEGFCDAAIAANPGPVADYKAGKAAALNFLKGQVMKLSKGKANPALAGEILERRLKE
jgi:aspartyl-tRNA(Asn)/glutamyl-tRNA(Gln) amidotransferase subunit B